MSFFSDLFKGDFSNLGTDIEHSGSSLINHPDELAETAGGVAALATGGLALGALPELGAGLAGADFLGGEAAAGGSAVASGTDSFGLDALAAGASPELPPAVDAASLATGNSGAGGYVGNLFGLDPSVTGASPSVLSPTVGGDATGALGGGGAGGGGSFFDSSAAAAAYGGGPGAGAPGGGGILSSLTNPTLSGVAKGAGVAVAGGGLLTELMRKTGAPAQQQALQQEAGNLQSQGQQLQSYLSTGTLPPALQAQLNQATAAEKARIISGYASRGQPTDPSQNSALAQELNGVDTNAIAAMAQTQIQMLNTGIQETGMSTQLYETLIKLDQGNNKDLMASIASLAAALGGAGGGGMTLKLAA